MRPVPRVLLRILVTLLLASAGVLVMNIPSLIRSRRLARPWFVTLNDTGVVQPDSLATDSLRLLEALRTVTDPELGLDIVELGLVHQLKLDSLHNVLLALALTTPECPYASQLAGEALNALQVVPGIHRIEVRTDPKAPWHPGNLDSLASERFRRLFGSNAPPRR